MLVAPARVLADERPSFTVDAANPCVVGVCAPLLHGSAQPDLQERDGVRGRSVEIKPTSSISASEDDKAFVSGANCNHKSHSWPHCCSQVNKTTVNPLLPNTPRVTMINVYVVMGN